MGILLELECCSEPKIKSGNGSEITRSDKLKISRIKTNARNIDIGEFTKKMLKLHNELRHLYSVPELKENSDLNKLAGNYVQNLIKNDNNSYSPNIYKDMCLGENVSISKTDSPEEIFEMWSQEGKYYNFNTKKYSRKASHFTQIIWKETTDLGFGFWFDEEKDEYYTVILYYPPGNSFTDFSSNITNSLKSINENENEN